MHSFNAIDIFIHNYNGQVVTRNILFDSKPSLCTCACASHPWIRIYVPVRASFISATNVRTARSDDGVVNRPLLELLGVAGRNYLCTTVQLISSNACTTPN